MRKKPYIPKRGDVIRLDFDPQTGHEQAGRRPAIVLSPDEYNRVVGLVIVCPITGQVKGYPWEVEIPPNPLVFGVILADQIKNLDWRERHAEFVCTPGGNLLSEVIDKAFALVSVEEDDAG